MRDARLRPEGPGSICKKEEIAQWRERVESFLAAEFANEGANPGKAPVQNSKWHRIATFDLVCGMDWQIRASLGPLVHSRSLLSYRRPGQALAA